MRNFKDVIVKNVKLRDINWGLKVDSTRGSHLVVNWTCDNKLFDIKWFGHNVWLRIVIE